LASYYGLGAFTDLDQLSSWWAKNASLRKLLNQPSGIAATLEEAEAIAIKWGLNADWGPALILQQASGLIFCGAPQEEPFKFPVGFIRDVTWTFPPSRKFVLRPVWDFLFPPILSVEPSEIDDEPNLVEGNAQVDRESLPQTVDLPGPAVILLEAYDPTYETREAFLKRAMEKLRQEATTIEGIYRERGAEP
jgi:hypothetical protein